MDSEVYMVAHGVLERATHVKQKHHNLWFSYTGGHPRECPPDHQRTKGYFFLVMGPLVGVRRTTSGHPRGYPPVKLSL
jgi:hypothetical protein